MFVTILGLIGTGKSTITNLLAKRNDFIQFQEPVEDNPFLESYYKDPTRWSYALQVTLLFYRYLQVLEGNLDSFKGHSTAMDSSIFSDMAFALVQKKYNYFTDAEWNSYLRMHQILTSQLAYPDLIIYLRLSPEQTLERIRQRNRECESGITIEYLRDLEESYSIVLNKLRERAEIKYIDATPCIDDVYDSVLHTIEEYRENNKYDMLRYL